MATNDDSDYKNEFDKAVEQCTTMHEAGEQAYTAYLNQAWCFVRQGSPDEKISAAYRCLAGAAHSDAFPPEPLLYLATGLATLQFPAQAKPYAMDILARELKRNEGELHVNSYMTHTFINWLSEIDASVTTLRAKSSSVSLGWPVVVDSLAHLKSVKRVILYNSVSGLTDRGFEEYKDGDRELVLVKRLADVLGCTFSPIQHLNLCGLGLGDVGFYLILQAIETNPNIAKIHSLNLAQTSISQLSIDRIKLSKKIPLGVVNFACNSRIPESEPQNGEALPHELLSESTATPLRDPEIPLKPPASAKLSELPAGSRDLSLETKTKPEPKPEPKPEEWPPNLGGDAVLGPRGWRLATRFERANTQRMLMGMDDLPGPDPDRPDKESEESEESEDADEAPASEASAVSSNPNENKSATAPSTIFVVYTVINSSAVSKIPTIPKIPKITIIGTFDNHTAASRRLTEAQDALNPDLSDYGGIAESTLNA